ncbi:hypothetical protein M1506_03485 [Patescibacteria group bacterium]|nr:hypothetical protein [Patescibacteria group bacterium]
MNEVNKIKKIYHEGIISVNPLEDITLAPEKIREIFVESTGGSLASHIPIIKDILDWTGRVDRAKQEAKTAILLRTFSSHFDNVDDAIKKIIFLNTNASARILFQKTIQLTTRGGDDVDWIILLGNLLYNISTLEIEKIFEEYQYVLAQIEKLSPQGLLVLSKYDIWKKIPITGAGPIKDSSVEDWDSQAANVLARELGIKDSGIIPRIAHSFVELESSKLVILIHPEIRIGVIGAQIYRAITVPTEISHKKSSGRH